MSKVGPDINNLSTPFPSQSSGIDSEWWRGSETIINFRTYFLQSVNGYYFQDMDGKMCFV